MLNGIRNIHSIEYYILDVFTLNQYGGNQLAVFLDINNLLDENAMLAITREVNFSETTFIKSKTEMGEYRVRIYTPEYEVPFAGHPLIGTGSIISEIFDVSGPINIKLNTMSIMIMKEDFTFSFSIEDVNFFNTYNKKEIASLFSIAECDIKEYLPIQEISTGLPYIIVPLKNVNALNNISMNTNEVINFLIENKIYKDVVDDGLTRAFYFYTEDTEDNTYHARMFCLENNQIFEDAATGSAASCLIAYLLENCNSKIDAIIHQGCFMNRHSKIFIQGSKIGCNYSMKIGGNTKINSKGVWYHQY